ncbi:ORF6N domain-containing protein [Enterococcus hirae]|uniref:ORF6N domain-containing protein n=1 Tax=Enterococcus hirae TaxID=1354 RepID=UPI001A0B5713|nr:ORF6C domain-containing protein [Enterococcus hirae]EMF0128789.1 ORF6C domain-containing protein [Enterococcus hirae]EMF0206939.1 ORF6C domain-containing protein [Enterococcus hirae]EMF0226197.1 ORF6C domain-containing protein [Enterococcus hirae]
MNTPQIIELHNQRLLTTEQLAEFYEVTSKNIRDNFQNNREKFIEGKHFYRLAGTELKAFKNYTENIGIVGSRVNQLYLWTKRGASRHSKMLGTDKAWDMFDELEENYFSMREQIKIPSSPRELAKLALAANEETNQRLDNIEEQVSDLKENQPLPQGDYNIISKRINKRVYEVAKAYSINCKNKKIIGMLFKDINSGVKKVTGVGARTQLRAKHYEKVMDFINSWEPSSVTKFEMRQIQMEI